MTIAASATKRGGKYFPITSHTGNYGASQNEMTIAASATERGGRYFLHHTPEITVLQKMK
ncbi:MAG: hypothetical protein SWX82_01525 [Cyanobacteriota bacterium]|nr:hypothetical protein [Cyanobacteriota bacterium]